MLIMRPRAFVIPATMCVDRRRTAAPAPRGLAFAGGGRLSRSRRRRAL